MIKSFARNAPMGMVPVVGIFSCWGLGGLLTHVAYNSFAEFLATALLAGSIIPIFVMVKRDIRGYLERLKLDWLRLAEQRRKADR
ncbi:hypothetical protein [Actinomadura sp. 21ATH]|uniref:hypothetical protein n=1 Tax=Actinomadura sp. 21ATH TaxID=1735444 RepID=UPI0035C08C64